MAGYIAIFFILFLFSFVKTYRKYLFYFLVIFLIVFGGFRAHYIGADTKSGYQAIYDWICSGSNVGYIEPAWRFLNRLSISMNWGYTGVIFLAECLCVLPVAYVIEKSSVNQIFALAVYYGMYLFLHSFNMIRQCIAMSFCFLSFYFFLKKKRVWALLYFSAAFLFHKSAIIFLLVPLVSKKNISFRLAIILCCLSFLLGLSFTSKILIFLAGPYGQYLQGSKFGFREKNIILVLFAALIDIFFLLYLFLAGKRKVESPWAKCLLLGICCLNATQTLVLGTRLMFYFTQAQIIFYPEYMGKRRHEKVFLYFLLVLYFFFNFIKILLGQIESLTPYKFVFFQ